MKYHPLLWEIYMRFSFCWWNTGLAPPKGDKNDPDHLDKVFDTIEMLLSNRDIDLLCLGEVDSQSLDKFRKIKNNGDFYFVDGASNNLGVNFNMNFIARKSIIKINERRFHVATVEASRKKVAQSMEIILSDDSIFSFFVVHWPSRLLASPETNIRGMLGQALRVEIDKILDNDAGSNIIVLGDFNDEPYNDSIARYLTATRDISMVQKNQKLLYNPFWRSLADKELYSIKNPVSNCKGTYYYEADKIHRWKTFDQILVSSSLLGKGGWHLCEDETVIWEDPDILGVGPRKSKQIDHLPVFGVVERRRL